MLKTKMCQQPKKRAFGSRHKEKKQKNKNLKPQPILYAKYSILFQILYFSQGACNSIG